MNRVRVGPQLLRCGFCVFLSLVATPLFAQSADKAKRTWSVEASAGVEYDSNVSVDQLNVATGLSDFAGVAEFSVDFDPKLGENTSLYLGYDFNQSLYFDLSDFNLQSHLITASLDHRIGSVNVGAMYNFAYAFLGGEEFLEFHNLSPYVSFFLSDSVYLRTFYEFADKSIFPSPERDTQDQGGGADLFYFIDGVGIYVSGGYRYQSVDAVGPEFDFSGHRLRAKFVTLLPLGGASTTLKLGGSYELRNYENLTPSISAIRDDDIFRLTAEWEIPLGEYLFSELKYQYQDYISNLPTADYSRNVLTIKLGARY